MLLLSLLDNYVLLIMLFCNRKYLNPLSRTVEQKPVKVLVVDPEGRMDLLIVIKNSKPFLFIHVALFYREQLGFVGEHIMSLVFTFLI